MWLLERLFGPPIECVKCGRVIKANEGRAKPILRDIASVMAGGVEADSRQALADEAARRERKGLRCASCYNAEYEKLPAVRTKREIDNLLAHDLSRRLMPLVRAGMPLDGVTIEHPDIQVDHDGHPRFVRDD